MVKGGARNIGLKLYYIENIILNVPIKPTCLCGVCKKCQHRLYMKNYNKDPKRKKKALELKKRYRETHKEILNEKQKQWVRIEQNHQRKLEYDRNYKKREGYREHYNTYKREWYKTHPNYKKEEYKRNYETYKKYQDKIKEKYWSDPEFRAIIKQDQRDWYYNRGGRQISQAYYKKHPRMVGHSYPRDMFWAMYEARVRDKNKCQWGGCGKKADHTHHIFSVAKYPELRHEKWNLISYCGEHHAKFHEAKCEKSTAGLLKAQIRSKAKKTVSHSLNHHSIT